MLLRVPGAWCFWSPQAIPIFDLYDRYEGHPRSDFLRLKNLRTPVRWNLVVRGTHEAVVRTHIYFRLHS